MTDPRRQRASNAEVRQAIRAVRATAERLDQVFEALEAAKRQIAERPLTWHEVVVPRIEELLAPANEGVTVPSASSGLRLTIELPHVAARALEMRAADLGVRPEQLAELLLAQALEER
jgi:hypothetical protein